MANQILLKGKQSGIILALRDTSQSWYITSLAKVSGTTYVHACNFLNECEDLGIVSSEKHGKIKLIKLTDKGIKIAEYVANMQALIATPNKPQGQIPAAPASQEPKP